MVCARPMKPAPIRPMRISRIDAPPLSRPAADRTLPYPDQEAPGQARRCPDGSTLHRRAEVPRRELVVAVAIFLAPRFLARRRVEDHLEDALADFLQRGRAVDDLAAVDVHVVLH